jgi:hypothetical protein
MIDDGEEVVGAEDDDGDDGGDGEDGVGVAEEAECGAVVLEMGEAEK